MPGHLRGQGAREHGHLRLVPGQRQEIQSVAKAITTRTGGPNQLVNQSITRTTTDDSHVTLVNLSKAWSCFFFFVFRSQCDAEAYTQRRTLRLQLRSASKHVWEG